MNSEKKHLIQSSISSYESNYKTIAAVPTVIEQSGRGEKTTKTSKATKTSKTTKATKTASKTTKTTKTQNKKEKK